MLKTVVAAIALMAHLILLCVNLAVPLFPEPVGMFLLVLFGIVHYRMELDHLSFVLQVNVLITPLIVANLAVE